MPNPSLEQLKNNSLVNIVKEVKIKCELENKSNLDTIKYADLISSALTCEWFRNVLREWDPSLYYRLEIEQKYFAESKSVHVSLDQLYKRLQEPSHKDKKGFWRVYINALESNTKVEKIELNYIGETFNEDHGEILNMFIAAIRDKGRLKKLTIDMKGWSLDRLPQFPHLTRLSINTKLKAVDLVDFCKLNPSLSRLDLMSNEVNGKITDIVPHCKALKELTLTSKSGLNGSDYAQFAELENLENLRMVGVDESGCLSPLIRALAIKEPSTLKKLIIDETAIESTDALEVCRMKSLQELKCRLVGLDDFSLTWLRSTYNEVLSLNFENEQTDATDLAFLSNLTSLRSLHIHGQHKVGTLKSLFEQFAEKKSPNLECFKSRGDKGVAKLNNEEILEVLKIESLKSLNFCFADTKSMELPKQLPKITSLTIETLETGSMQNLFKALSQQICSELNELTVEGSPLSLEDLTEISKISSLTELSCKYIEIDSISQIAHHDKLQSLTISSKHQLNEFCQAILRFVEESQGNISIYSPENYIVLDKITRALTITMTTEIDSLDLKPLASLPSLPNLSIYGGRSQNSLTELLEAFGSSASTVLQELLIAGPPISQREVEKIAQIKTLRYLECSFSAPESIKLLRDLSALETLRITSSHSFHDIKDEVFQVLLGCSNEITVIRHFREITLNKNLSKLTILNSSYDGDVHNAQEYGPLGELPEWKSLEINGIHEPGTFKDLFGSLALMQNSMLEEIVFKSNDTDLDGVKGAQINYEETLELTKIGSLKRLECGFSHGECLMLLTKLSNLEELTITSYPDGSLVPFFRELSAKEHYSLQSLILSGNSLTFEEVEQVSKVNNLKRLKLTLGDGQNMELLAKIKQLEELSLGADECDSLETLLRALSAAESRNLLKLSITNRALSLKEMMLIVEIKNLRQLCCKLNDSECLNLFVRLPEITELSLDLEECDTKGIEKLAQLNNLTHLEIISPQSCSLTSLFQQLANRDSQILQTLIVGVKDIDSIEMEAISRLKSLKSLKCAFDEEVFYESLSDLTDLEVLHITSYLYFDDIAQKLLQILQKCHKINDIKLQYGSRFVGLQFVLDALNILKKVRNPQVQEPLRIHIPYFGGLTPEQIPISDAKYLCILRFKEHEDFEDCLY